LGCLVLAAFRDLPPVLENGAREEVGGLLADAGGDAPA